MSFVRVIAEYQEGGSAHNKYKVSFLCAINEHHRISDGEWFGYVKDETVTYPFILKGGSEFFYGGDEHEYEATNLGEKAIEVDSYFTVFISSPRENFEAIYKIVSVHTVND